MSSTGLGVEQDVAVAGRRTVPCDRCFWALLDAPGVNTRGELPIGLHAALEEVVPLGAGELHAVCTPAAGGRLAVCAVPHKTLAAIPTPAMLLTPDAVPEFLSGLCHPGQFNLLSGPHEPAPIRRARVHRHMLAAAALALSAALIAIGLARRSEHWSRSVIASDAVATALVARLSPTMTPRDLPAALAQSRARREALAGAVSSPDAAATLATLLAAWPAATPSKPQSLSVAPGSITIGVNVEGDPSIFLHAFKAPAGWTLDEPRLNAAGDITRLSLQLRPGAEVHR